jgi:hypothetical protein
MAELPDWAVSQIVQRAGRGLTDSDIDRIVQSATDAASFAFDRIATRGMEAMAEHDRPSTIYRPALRIDGNQWCALYGESLEEGVAGFGDSPAEAVYDFDRAWHAKLPASVAPGQPAEREDAP